MWKNIILIALVIGISSCGSKKTVVDSDKTKTKKEIVSTVKGVDMAYQSLGNDMGSIYLELFENNTFKFKMKIFPSEDDDSESKTTNIDTKGTYTNDGSWKILHFKNPKFSLAAIFDPQFANTSYFEVLDKERVRINTSKNTLPIWGVICEKQ